MRFHQRVNILTDLSAFLFYLGRLKADLYQKPYHVIGRVGQKHRDPMELVHMVRRIDTVSCTKRSEHLGRELQINHVDYLVAVKSKLAPGHA